MTAVPFVVGKYHVLNL